MIRFLLGSNEAYVIDVSDVSDVSSCVAGAINRVPMLFT